jgi:NitT/TauT family transport system permease protein
VIQRAVRRTALFVVALICVVVLWELWKALGPEKGGEVFGMKIIPKTNDRVMPHTWEMFAEFFDPEVRDTPLIWQAVLGYAWFTFRLALVGLALGTIIGVGLAVVMARFGIIERGLAPYVIASQTVPLIALAPQIATIAGNWGLPKWMWVSTLGAFLAFFPITVATVKGLKAAPPAALELMDSYASGWWKTLVKLRFPAALPAMVPGLKLAATASVIGVIVSEVSTGLSGGIGKAALTYSQKATSEPAQVYTAVIGAAVLGLALFGVVAALELVAMRNRPTEVAA